MTCDQKDCTLEVFECCKNHCKKKFCLEHLIEHGDQLIDQFSNLITKIEKTTNNLFEEIQLTKIELLRRQRFEIEEIDRRYEEEQSEIRQKKIFSENLEKFLKEKFEIIEISRRQSTCLINRHDFEQLKIWRNELEENSTKKMSQAEKVKKTVERSSLEDIQCPLTKENVFGIRAHHNVRCHCRGPSLSPLNLSRHFEKYHRMLPQSAQRLKAALINGDCPQKTNLFSEDEIIQNQNYNFNCPLTNRNFVFGADLNFSKLSNIPCKKKQLALPSALKHFRVYHRVEFDAAKKICSALKKGSIQPDLILFQTEQNISADENIF